MPRKSKEVQIFTENLDNPEDDEFNLKCRAALLTLHDEKTNDLESLQVMHNYYKSLYDDACMTTKLELTHDGDPHQHIYMQWKRQIQCTTEHLAYNGKKPNCVPNRVKGSGFHVAVDRGHFYLQNKYKIGSVACITDREILEVKPQWIKTQFQQGKIKTCDVIEAMTYYNCLTVPQRRDIEELIAKKSEFALQQKIEANQKILDAQKMPFDTYPIFDEFDSQFKTMKTRYKCLVIHGEKSDLGKTELAKSRYKNPFIHEDTINWKGYDPDVHDAIIYDDVKNIFKYVSDHRVLFKSANSLVTVNESAVNAYAWKIYVYGKPQIITCNPEIMEGTWLDQNSYKLHVTEHTCPHLRGRPGP